MPIPFSNKVRVKILDTFRRTNQLKVYKEYLRNQFEYSKEDIDRYQEKKFKDIFEFHYYNNPTYRNFIESRNFKMDKHVIIQSVPLLSKAYFRENITSHSLQKEIAKTKYSGGSTGTPLTYYLNKASLEGQWPALWRAFDNYGIHPCDKVMMIAGPSLFNNRSLKRRVYDHISRFTVVSAFDLSGDTLEKAYQTILKKGIKVIYGYTSSVLIFLQFLKRRSYQVAIKVIFTTSETFIPSIRALAKEYCSCDVVDTYGANDGGVQAFECQFHKGYHLNFERCLVEVIDGEIVLTDLLNRASPFIRYRIGDYTSQPKIIKEKCECGRSLFRLADISGRENQYIEDTDSNKIHTEFFSHLFGSDTHIIQFQIIQKYNKIYINIVHDKSCKDEHYIIKYSHLIKKRIKMPSELEFNKPIKRLKNMKVPILLKE